MGAAQVARNAVMPFNYPFDTVRRRVMLESEKAPADRIYKGSLHCASEIMKKEGLKGMYKGMIPELARGVGGSMVIVAYDRIKDKHPAFKLETHFYGSQIDTIVIFCTIFCSHW